MELEVISPRPVAEAALLLEKRFNCPITYEDVPYLYADDMVRDKGGLIVPRGGRISIQYEAEDSLCDVIHRALEAHERFGYPGLFAVEGQAGNYHIVPHGFRNADGLMEERHSLLNTTISLTSQLRDGFQFVESILLAVGEARDASVGPGTVPINALLQHRSVAGIAKGQVRDLLVDLFREMRLRLSWQLFNVPGTAEFVLNIHRLPDVDG